jgi:tape measure domain-containing protein
LNDAEVKLQVKIDDSTASKGIDSMQSKTENLSKSFTNAGKKLTAGLTVPIVGLIGVGVKYNATVEDLTTSFKVMTGSAEKAGDIVERLKDIGSKTPFEFTDLAETTKLLMNYGLTADDAISKMEMLGDISQGNADKMNRISMAYGQMSSAGKVNLQDIKQMIDAGFNPLKEISESTGESMSSLYDRISNGTISVDEITKSMERSTSAGGKYFGSMEQQSQTTTGKLSTLKDEFLSATGSLTESLIPALQSGVTWLTNISIWFSNLSEEQRKMILIVMGVLAVIGPLLMLFGKLIPAITGIGKVIAFLTSPIGLIVLAIGALIGVFVYLMATSEEFRNAMYNIFNFVWGIISPIINNIKILFSGLMSIIKGFVMIVSGLLTGDMRQVVNGFGNIFKGIGNVVISVLNGVLNTINKFIKLALIPLNVLISGINLIPGVKIPKLKISIPNIPALNVGTNYVAQEGLAYLHQGEAVVPKKYNPAIGGGNGNMNNQVYVNVEVQQDKFGNYTNTIKTFSNGSKNSYNYGAS